MTTILVDLGVEEAKSLPYPGDTPVTHELKTHPGPFGDVERGHKTFEVRFDDRGFAVGDLLLLREYRPSPGDEYTGKTALREVTHVLRGPAYGVNDGYVVMSIAPVGLVSPLAAQPEPSEHTGPVAEAMAAFERQLAKSGDPRDAMRQAMQMVSIEIELRDAVVRAVRGYMDHQGMDAYATLTRALDALGES